MLKMKYDDGFVAYLNGREIARGNAPASLNWRSTAAGSRDDGAAAQWEPFDISAFRRLFRQGANVLAIHGLNRSADSSDALWLPELVWIDRSGSKPAATAAEYSQPVRLVGNTTVRAAVLVGNRWSPVTSATFFPGAVPASPGNLTISEIHYHPAPAGEADGEAGGGSAGASADADAFEFVELRNTGGETVALHGLRFREGITGAIEALALAPDESVVVVKDRQAFRRRYGDAAGARIAGEYHGSLGNGGETIRLVNAGGDEIAAVTYDDKAPWPLEADGTGKSLEQIDPRSHPDLDDPANWRASEPIGGSPLEH